MLKRYMLVYAASVFFTIVSVPISEYSRITQKNIPHTPLVYKALFVPDDPVKDILLGLIDSEQIFIYGALFRLSDKDIAQKLIEAHARGVKVRLVVDCTAFGDKYGKLNQLTRVGITIYTFNHPNSTMHNKFLLFGKTIYGKQLLWTGSANTTFSGVKRNEENVIIIENKDMYAAYMKKFNMLQKCSDKMKKTRSYTDSHEHELSNNNTWWAYDTKINIKEITKVFKKVMKMFKLKM